ncbi:aldehyde dehydrogenase family protein [Burkholderia sp. BCC1644]|uniref:aldehyde dehydrogenase family protein n=1 Tax=Burkholderia sp. BCC1644 TaxID=2676293 RepID=UPI00159150ED|nr:aldehyde dehydrogenase family protein [Burkholderia sp. BCC1644]
MTDEKAELERILDVQRAAFLAEGGASAEVRKSRVGRLAIAVLSNFDAIAEALSADYGNRPPELTKALEALPWSEDILYTLDNIEKWMEPEAIPGGFIQQKPKGVVGVMGAWNFPVTLTFEPALSALAAGNRVMMNFPEYQVRTGRLLAKIVSDTFDEAEVAFIHGDLSTSQSFSALRFDHLFFTGSPKIGSIVAQVAARNLVPVTTELGGKNPVVVAPDADLDLAASRIAATRVVNGGQVCLCPDYVWVPRGIVTEFVDKLITQYNCIFPSCLENPAVVSIVNERNFDRIVGLVTDATAKGAKKYVAAPEGEAGRLPDRASRKIPPTILVDVPASAEITDEEVFGPVLVVYGYDDLQEAIDYITARPAPLAAYWYGDDGAEFRRFLDRTTSGGVTRNDGLLHALLPGAPFGGIGNSGSGAYHGKTGFDTFTHRRSVATITRPDGVANPLVGDALVSEQTRGYLDGSIAAAIKAFEERLPEAK